MTIAERLDAYLAHGLELFLDNSGGLCVRGPAVIVVAARPSLRQHRAALIAYLGTSRAADQQSSAPSEALSPHGVSERVCPNCAHP